MADKIVTPNKQNKILARILASELTSDELLSIMDAYPKWQAGKVIEEDDAGNLLYEGKPYKNLYLRYESKLYKTLSPHTTQADWTPDVAVSLFAEVSPPGTIPVWSQPTGAHDAYDKGAQVEWPEGGKIWQSTIDANTTEPGTLTEHGYWIEV